MNDELEELEEALYAMVDILEEKFPDSKFPSGIAARVQALADTIAELNTDIERMNLARQAHARN